MPVHSWMLIALTFGCAAALPAQTASPLIGEARQSYDAIKTNLLKAAEKMPEDAYSFKPTPEIRTFGQLIAHIADAQTRNCSGAKGTAKQGTAASKTAKADLVAAMKESIAECDSAFDTITDANATEMVKFRNTQ